MPPKISDKTPGEKLLALYTLLMLQGDRRISLAGIANTLGCSKQTVLRLLAQLEASGYGKLDEPLRKGKEYFYRLAKTDDRILDLGPGELRQLALCRNLLMRLLPDPKGDVGGIFCDGEKAVAPPVGIMYKGFIDYAPFETQYSCILKAIQNRLVCKISYQKSIFALPRDIFFAPVRLISYHETLSAVGWEVPQKGKVRSLYPNWLWLYLQRCKKVKLTTRSSAELPDINLTTEDKAEFGIMDGKIFTVKLLFNERTANYIYDRIWSSDQLITILADKNLILEMKVRSAPEIVSWVLGFGSDVKVLEPEWLKKEIVARSAEVVKNY